MSETANPWPKWKITRDVHPWWPFKKFNEEHALQCRCQLKRGQVKVLRLCVSDGCSRILSPIVIENTKSLREKKNRLPRSDDVVQWLAKRPKAFELCRVFFRYCFFLFHLTSWCKIRSLNRYVPATYSLCDEGWRNAEKKEPNQKNLSVVAIVLPLFTRAVERSRVLIVAWRSLIAST